MAASPSQSIVDQVRALPPDEQLRVAEAIDKLTWANRWRLICRRIAERIAHSGAVRDEQVDADVRAVRKEKPLSERSSIPPS